MTDNKTYLIFFYIGNEVDSIGYLFLFCLTMSTVFDVLQVVIRT